MARQVFSGEGADGNFLGWWERPLSGFGWLLYLFIVVVQSWSHVPLFACLWTAAWQAPLSSTVSWSWFPLGLTGLISLLSKGLPRVFSSTTIDAFKPWLLYTIVKTHLTEQSRATYLLLCQLNFNKEKQSPFVSYGIYPCFNNLLPPIL